MTISDDDQWNLEFLQREANTWEANFGDRWVLGWAADRITQLEAFIRKLEVRPTLAPGMDGSETFRMNPKTLKADEWQPFRDLLAPRYGSKPRKDE